MIGYVYFLPTLMNPLSADVGKMVDSCSLRTECHTKWHFKVPYCHFECLKNEQALYGSDCIVDLFCYRQNVLLTPTIRAPEYIQLRIGKPLYSRLNKQ